MNPTVIVRVLHRLGEDLHSLGGRFFFRLLRRRGGRSVPLFIPGFGEIFHIDKPVTGATECFRGLTLTKAVDHKPVLPQPLRQTGEIAVGTNEAKSVELALVHEIHSVDHQRDVGSVLARGVVTLLMLQDRERLYRTVPSRKTAP